jgi:hypothetical protein
MSDSGFLEDDRDFKTEGMLTQGTTPSREGHCLVSRAGKGIATHNLEFYGFPFQFNSTNLEVDANGTDVALSVCVVRETK